MLDHRAYASAEIEIRYVDVTDMARRSWSSGTAALTLRGRQRCLVLIREPYSGDQCVLRHELKHCAGYSHPNYPLTPSRKLVCGAQSYARGMTSIDPRR